MEQVLEGKGWAIDFLLFSLRIGLGTNDEYLELSLCNCKMGVRMLRSTAPKRIKLCGVKTGAVKAGALVAIAGCFVQRRARHRSVMNCDCHVLFASIVKTSHRLSESMSS